MRGYEGGIPYGFPPNKPTVHVADRNHRPICGGGGWRYQTSPRKSDCTCFHCLNTLTTINKENS